MDGRPIGYLYMGQKKITIKIEGKFSEPGSVARELSRGAHSHPYLFNLYIEERTNPRSTAGNGRRNKGE